MIAGADLSGNTFWEFKDAINAGRMRRIVQYSNQGHYADVKISRTLSDCLLSFGYSCSDLKI